MASRCRARSGDLAPFVILMYRQGLYVVGARMGAGYTSDDLHPDAKVRLGVVEGLAESQTIFRSRK